MMLEGKSKWKAQRILYVAPSGMGKTYLMCERVLKYIKEKRYEPKHIIIFASNHITDTSLAPLIKRCSKDLKSFQKDHCFKDINVDLINALYESQNQIMEKQLR